MPGSALLPTMPYLPESTSTGGRDWRGYPQWWAVPLDATRLPPVGGVLTVRLTARAGEARLRADRFAGQELTYEGPSFGERPNVVALKEARKLGRPRRIESPEVMEAAAASYFARCEERGSPVTLTYDVATNAVTVGGLAAGTTVAVTSGTATTVTT